VWRLDHITDSAKQPAAVACPSIRCSPPDEKQSRRKIQARGGRAHEMEPHAHSQIDP